MHHIFTTLGGDKKSSYTQLRNVIFTVYLSYPLITGAIGINEHICFEQPLNVIAELGCGITPIYLALIRVKK